MALLHSDGFDIYANIDQVLDSGWSRRIAASSFSTTDGRFGGGCLSGAFQTGSTGWYYAVPVLVDDPLYLAFAYYHSGSNTNDVLFEAFTAANVLVGRVTVTTTGQVIAADSGGSTVETSVGTPLTASTWHWVEIKIIPGSTASNGEITVRVDASTVINQTAIDTQVALGTIAYFRLAGPRNTSGGAVVYIDDLFIMDDSGSAFNGFMADRRIHTLIPNVDGGAVNWTASSSTDVSCVDDALGAANDDTDYISSSTAAQESRFGMTNLSVSPASVDAVVPRYRAKKADAGTRTMRALINSNGTEALSATQGLSTAYTWKRGSAALTNPDGGGAWTESAVNALEVGVEVVA